MKFLLDMNISPLWIEVLKSNGWETVHWSQVGDPRAPDRDVLKWAKDNGYVLFTHDLDFGSILAASGDSGPSVIQIRIHNALPDSAGELLVKTVKEHRENLTTGALISIDAVRQRLRILPLR